MRRYRYRLVGLWAHIPLGGRHWPRRGYGNVPRSWPPFFQASRRSLVYQFTVNAPLKCPLYQLLEKNSIFSLVFGQNFSSQDANFHSQDPSFFKEILLPRPYILKPAGHTPTKKSWVPPPHTHIPCFECHISLVVHSSIFLARGN